MMAKPRGKVSTYVRYMHSSSSKHKAKLSCAWNGKIQKGEISKIQELVQIGRVLFSPRNGPATTGVLRGDERTAEH